MVLATVSGVQEAAGGRLDYIIANAAAGAPFSEYKTFGMM